MTTYAPPLREMLFAMKEHGGLDAVLAQPGNEEVTGELVGAILDEASKFAANVLAPINGQGDTQGCRWHDGAVTTADGFKKAYAGFCESGWNGMPAAVEFGGQGMPHLVAFLFSQSYFFERGNVARGQRVFENKTCASCHRLFDEGSRIGPELTGSQRHNLDYLLDNVLDPSAIVPREYKVNVLRLTDGRVVQGVILEETPHVLTVQTANAEPPSVFAHRMMGEHHYIGPHGLMECLGCGRLWRKKRR
jgi:putative heme-binding domain-containing protein